MTPNTAAGQQVEEVLRNIKSLPDNHRQLQDQVADVLTAAGFAVLTEVSVTDYWRGRNGRVNIVALRDGGAVAIELDNRSPRERSVYKLRCLDAYRIIALRGAGGVTTPHGIDAVIPLDVAGKGASVH